VLLLQLGKLQKRRFERVLGPDSLSGLEVYCNQVYLRLEVEQTPGHLGMHSKSSPDLVVDREDDLEGLVVASPPQCIRELPERRIYATQRVLD